MTDYMGNYGLRPGYEAVALGTTIEKTAEEKKALKEKYKLENDTNQWKTATVNLRAAKIAVAKAQTALQNAQNSADIAQSTLDKLMADGFVIPEAAIEPAAPVYATSKVDPIPAWKKNMMAPTDEGRLPEKVPCSVCSEMVSPGIAYHRTDGDFTCVIDAVRARGAGLTPERIEEALERQRIAAENRLQQEGK
jgi:phospholipase C